MAAFRIETEDDGRILASFPDLPGVMAYGVDEREAVRRATAIARQTVATMIEDGEDVPESVRELMTGDS